MCSIAIRGLLFIFVIAPFLKGASCVPNSLANDIALGSCTVGPNLTFQDFGFQLVSSTGITLPISASQITVTPDASGMGLDFSSAPLFQLSAGQSVNLVMTYEVEAPGISQAGITLGAPTFTTPLASIDLDQSLCPNCTIPLGACPDLYPSNNVYANSGGAQLASFVMFAPGVTMIGVTNCFTDAATYVSSPETVQSYSPPSLPEPTSLLLCF